VCSSDLELHRIRLFLKVTFINISKIDSKMRKKSRSKKSQICEINNKSLNENELNMFFSLNEDMASEKSPNNKLKGMSKIKLLSSLYLK